MERNKESLKIIKSIHDAETKIPSTTGRDYLKYLSFSHLKALGVDDDNSIMILSLKLWYTSISIYLFNFITVILNFHILTLFTAIPSVILMAIGPFISFWSINFQLIRFQLFQSKLSGSIGLAALFAQNLIWVLMSLGFVSGASGGIFNIFSSFYAKNWLILASSLINFTLLAVSFTVSIFLKRKIIKILLL